MITAGSVFVHVISLHPVSGGHVMHTPPFPLAVGLILFGVGTIIGSIYVGWRLVMILQCIPLIRAACFEMLIVSSYGKIKSNYM